jgi:hypothetical protein
MKRDISVPVEFRLAVWTLRRMYGTCKPTCDELCDDAIMICSKRNLSAAFVMYAMKQIDSVNV